MDDLRRLIDDPDGSALGRSLLAAAQADAPSPAGRARAARRLGIAAVLAAGAGAGSEAGALAATWKLTAVLLALGGVVGLAIWQSPADEPPGVAAGGVTVHVARPAHDHVHDPAHADRDVPGVVMPPPFGLWPSPSIAIDAPPVRASAAPPPASLAPASLAPAPLPPAPLLPAPPRAASRLAGPVVPPAAKPADRPVDRSHPTESGTPGSAAVVTASPSAREPEVTGPAVAASEPAAPDPAAPDPAAPDPAAPDPAAAHAVATPPPPGTVEVAGPSRLAAEVALVDQARGRLSAGDHAAALAALAAYHQRFPSGDLDAEADMVMLEILIAQRARQRARTLGAEFLTRFPRSPLVQRVHSLIDHLPK